MSSIIIGHRPTFKIINNIEICELSNNVIRYVLKFTDKGLMFNDTLSYEKSDFYDKDIKSIILTKDRTLIDYYDLYKGTLKNPFAMKTIKNEKRILINENCLMIAANNKTDIHYIIYSNDRSKIKKILSITKLDGTIIIYENFNKDKVVYSMKNIVTPLIDIKKLINNYIEVFCK